jgi:hypothetical protein
LMEHARSLGSAIFSSNWTLSMHNFTRVSQRVLCATSPRAMRTFRITISTLLDRSRRLVLLDRSNQEGPLEPFQTPKSPDPLSLFMGFLSQASSKVRTSPPQPKQWPLCFPSASIAFVTSRQPHRSVAALLVLSDMVYNDKSSLCQKVTIVLGVQAGVVKLIAE